MKLYTLCLVIFCFASINTMDQQPLLQDAIPSNIRNNHPPIEGPSMITPQEESKNLKKEISFYSKRLYLVLIGLNICVGLIGTDIALNHIKIDNSMTDNRLLGATIATACSLIVFILSINTIALLNAKRL